MRTLGTRFSNNKELDVTEFQQPTPANGNQRKLRMQPRNETTISTKDFLLELEGSKEKPKVRIPAAMTKLFKLQRQQPEEMINFDVTE